MKTPHHQPPSSPKPKRGFALLVSIALMAFIFLLLLSITTLVQVESQTAGIAQQQMEARQIALYGLHEALGELQKAAGPDQRVTATAEILSNTPGYNAGRANYVGVWATADDATAGVTAEQQVAWLVSDAPKNASGNYDPDLHTTAPPNYGDSGTAVLVGGGSVTDLNQDGEADNVGEGVVVNLSELNENNVLEGRYGWWIGDEGVKAKVNLAGNEDPNDTAAKVKNNALTSLSSFSKSGTRGLSGLDLAAIDSNPERLIALNSLEILADPDALTTEELDKVYFHDLTTHSSGVLSDVKNGGLKKDLSLVFEMTDNDFNESEFGGGLSDSETIEAPGFQPDPTLPNQRVRPVFRFNEESYNYSPEEDFSGTANGPAWHMLRDYYRLYHVMETPMTTPTLDARVFGPNANHENTSMQTGTLHAKNDEPIESVPAVILAGGKVKSHNQENFSYDVFLAKEYNDEDEFPDSSVALYDTQHYSRDSIQLDVAGDPLRGGGSTQNGTTMPVMVTGNYLPYMMRFISQVGFFTAREESGSGIRWESISAILLDPVRIMFTYKERFIMHNPYNVSIRHNDMAVDSFGLQMSARLVDGDTGDTHRWANANNGGLATSHRTQNLTQRTERQIRMEADTFAPGEIKTFSASAFSNNMSYAEEGTDPEWKAPQNSGDVAGSFGYIPYPNTSYKTDPIANPAIYDEDDNGDGMINVLDYDSEYDGAAPDSFILHLYGLTASNGNVILSGWGSDHRYSLAEFAFATFLKPEGSSTTGLTRTQTGNTTQNQDKIAGIGDSWPMASIIDTGFILPGHDYYVDGDPFDANSTPDMIERFYPINGDNSYEITDSLIDEFENYTDDEERAENSKILGTFDLQLKPAQYTFNDARYPAYSYTNPLAPVRDSKNLLPADDFIENSVGFPKLSPDMDFTIDRTTLPDGTAEVNYWGPGDGTLAGGIIGVPNVSIIELPTTPVLSLGKLQHANISVHAHMPALAIGNSLPSIYIPRNQVYTMYENRFFQPRIFYDLSYLMNEALWDSYYFSGYSLPFNGNNFNSVSDSTSGSDTVQDTFVNVFENNTTNTLPNPRIKLHLGDTDTLSTVQSKLFDENGNSKAETNIGDTGDAGYQRAAENLLVDGSFNVNSTSVEAWTAVLSGARDMPVHQYGDETTIATTTSGTTPFARFAQPTGNPANGVTSQNAWNGFRSLTDEQITLLATAIVNELQLRSQFKGRPYLSLSEFVNRELSTPASQDFDRAGLLQAAIDKSGINEDYYNLGTAEINSSFLESTTVGRFEHADNILTATSDLNSGLRSAPTNIMQGDVLQAISSFINLRSDTFRIRSYGEVVNPITGDPSARIWLEAIVQRIPEPVLPPTNLSPSDPDYWTTIDDSSGATTAHGRKFIIVSVRKLSEEEV